jgi:predicted metal-binding protein
MDFDYSVEYFSARLPLGEFLGAFVDVPRFLSFCEGCPDFGGRWSCPPYDFDPLDYWGGFSEIEVFVSQIFPEGDTHEAHMECFRAEKRRLTELLMAKEAENPGSRHLSAGNCALCEKCTRPDGLPCRRPDDMRYSIESLGGDVVGVVQKLFGIELKWAKDGKLPEYYTLTTGLLLK